MTTISAMALCLIPKNVDQQWRLNMFARINFILRVMQLG